MQSTTTSTRILHTWSVTDPSPLDIKGAKSNSRWNFFSHGIVLICRLNLLAPHLDRCRKKATIIFFSCFYFWVALLPHFYFLIKEKLAFLAILRQAYFLREEFQKLHCTVCNTGLKCNESDNKLSHWSVRPLPCKIKFHENGSFVCITFVRLFLKL